MRILFLLLLFIASCSTLKQEDFDKIVLNETTYDEVIKIFGQPSYESIELKSVLMVKCGEKYKSLFYQSSGGVPFKSFPRNAIIRINMETNKVCDYSVVAY